MKSFENALTRTDDKLIENRSNTLQTTRPAPMWVDAGGQRASNLASYLEIPFIHKRLILGCTLIGILLGWLAILVWPRSYESEAKLTIRVGRESVSLDPAATTSATMMLQKQRDEEIVSALEVLNSRQVAETVVDKLGAEAILSGALPDDGSTEVVDAPPSVGDLLESARESTSEWLESVGITSQSLYSVLRGAGLKDDISDRELAVRALQSSADFHSPKNSTVIVIDAQSKTPKMAQAIVSEITESFLDEHLEGAHTKGSYVFFRQQSAEVEKQLNKLVAERSKFMQDADILSIDANRELLQQRLAGIDRDMVIASGEIEQVTSEIEDLKTKEHAADDEIVAGKMLGTDSTWSGMRQRVYELELVEGELAARTTDRHPDLIKVRKQLLRAHEILAQLKDERVDESTTPNPVKRKLYEELQSQETRLIGLRSMIDIKQEQRASMERQINELLEQERQLTDTDRNIRLMDASLQVLREKLEEARVIEGLVSNKITNLHVFQPATFVERAVSPEKKILAAGFLLLGLMTGLGLAVARQASSPALRTSEDVESQLGQPVVSTIPRLRRMESPRPKDQKLYLEKCRALLAEILLDQPHLRRTRGRSLGVIGVDVGSGASTLAMNLAAASSVDWRMQTVLVDADARQRSVSKMFGLNGSPGLVELVGGIASHDECLQRAKNVPIDLIASAADSCEEILSTNAPDIAQALEAYLNDCDLLIVDLPAAKEPDQAIGLAQHLDYVLVVVESEKTLTTEAERLLHHLTVSDTTVIGVVLNKTQSYLPKLVRRFVAPEV
jgi:uncharacterized protein involved in exopolysaccharide biosynthesis/Mrp family chromosome partitioning ATPase